MKMKWLTWIIFLLLNIVTGYCQEKPIPPWTPSDDKLEPWLPPDYVDFKSEKKNVVKVDVLRLMQLEQHEKAILHVGYERFLTSRMSLFGSADWSFKDFRYYPYFGSNLYRDKKLLQEEGYYKRIDTNSEFFLSTLDTVGFSRRMVGRDRNIFRVAAGNLSWRYYFNKSRTKGFFNGFFQAGCMFGIASVGIDDWFTENRKQVLSKTYVENTTYRGWKYQIQSYHIHDYPHSEEKVFFSGINTELGVQPFLIRQRLALEGVMGMIFFLGSDTRDLSLERYFSFAENNGAPNGFYIKIRMGYSF